MTDQNLKLMSIPDLLTRLENDIRLDATRRVPKPAVLLPERNFRNGAEKLLMLSLYDYLF